jgi:hypothetical protein
LDIDHTLRSLDTVLELIDADQNVLARSVSSFAESADPELLYDAPRCRTVPEWWSIR